MPYIFVDTSTNSVSRVTAADSNAAWRKYLSTVYGDLRTLTAKYGMTVTQAREGLEHDVFVLNESEIQEIL